MIKCFDLISDKTKKFFYKQRKYYDVASWVPRSCIAWKDLNYSQMPEVKKKMNYLFKEHTVLINRIYLIEVTDREVLKYTIKI